MDSHPPTQSTTEREYREILARSNMAPEDVARLAALLELEVEKRMEDDAL
jgi:hypothetical protein